MKEPERPQAVVLFETLSVVILALEIIFVSGLTWDDALWVPILLWIVLSITRRKSAIARWIFTAFFGFGWALIAFLLARGMVPLSGISWAGWLMTCAAIAQFALLWSRAVSRWIASKPEDTQRIGANA